MNNIIFVYERKIATVELLHKLFSNIEKRIHNIRCRFIKNDEITADDIRDSSVVVFIRCQDLLSQLSLTEFRKMGFFVVQFYDDDINAIPKEETRYVQRLPWRKRAIARGFQSTDCLLVSNTLLGAKYAELIPTKRYVVIDNPVSDELEYASYNEESCTVKLLYAGSSRHVTMFDKYIKPVFSDLASRYRGRISFTFMGMKPDLSGYESDIHIEYVAPMPLEEYRKAVKAGKYQIGIAPLEGNAFTQYKHYNKFIEYTVAGAVGVYSDVPPYNLVVKHGENGFLSGNTPEEWLETLSYAIDHEETRRNCYNNAYHLLRYERDYDSIVSKLNQELPELFRDKPVKLKPLSMAGVKLKFSMIRAVEVTYLTAHFLFNGGMHTALDKAKNYLNEKKTLGKERVR